MAAKILDSETSNFKSWSLKWKKRLESAAIIAASLLRYSSHPSTKKILELLAQSLRAIDDAVKAESKRLAQKNAELKSGTVAIGGGEIAPMTAILKPIWRVWEPGARAVESMTSTFDKYETELPLPNVQEISSDSIWNTYEALQAAEGERVAKLT